MKFIKSNFAKKLIIILVSLMIFNIAVPTQVKAWDFGGIILKPLYSSIMGVVAVIDVNLGFLINGISAPMNIVAAICDAMVENEGEAIEDANTAVQQIFIGPDAIFCGNVTMLNANIFEFLYISESGCICSDVNGDGKIDSTDYKLNCPVHKSKWNQLITGLESITDEVQDLTPGNQLVTKTAKAVAGIYVTLRNICGLIMLAGLIFTGIRILLSANIPTKKTQYLMLLQDWLIGMVLLIFSHIIMILVFEISDALVNVLSMRLSGFGGMNFQLFIRCLASFDSSEQLMCIIMLIYLLCLTFIFMISYFKRFFWVCILIVFAPVFSIMYAFGQQTKQFYSQWLKEYMLTVFVQPFHVVVYAVLVGIPLGIADGGSFDWANSGTFEMIYALIAMSFIRPAEKWMRGMFGMNKGIANMASYDSGKQTFDAIKGAVEDTVKKVGQVALAVTTGGASLGVTGMPGTEGNVVSDKELAGAMLDEENEKFGTSEWDPEYANKLAQDANPETEYLGGGWSNADEYLNFMAQNENYDSVDALREAYGQDGINDMLEAGGFARENQDGVDDFTPDEVNQLGKTITDGMKNNNEQNEALLNAANITIGSANIEMPGGEAFGQYGAQQIGEGDIAQKELPPELMDDAKKLLDDPSLGLTEEEKEGYMADPQKLADDLPTMKRNLTNKIGNKENVSKLISGIDGAIAERMKDDITPETDEYGGDPHADQRNRVRNLFSNYIKGKNNKKDFDFVTTHADGDELKALEEKGEMISRRKLMDNVSAGLKDNGYQPPKIGVSKGEGDSHAAVGTSNATGNGQDHVRTSNGQGGGTISSGNITINASSINLQGQINGSNIKTAETSKVQTIEEVTTKTEKDTKAQASQTQKIDDIEIEETISLKDGFETFKNLGGISEIASALNGAYKGLHSVTDTLYVDGQAPTDWKGTAGRTDTWIKEYDAKRKENVDRAKDNWANNKANITIMANKYLPDMQERYKDKPEAYIRMKAEEKAKSALKDMSAYVPYGITDVEMAYKLYKDANDYGYSPEQAIRSRAGYEKFNSHTENIIQVNNMPLKDAGKFTTVEQAIPNAKEYYHGGYTNVNDMARVDQIADLLARSPAFKDRIKEAPMFAMQIDETLKKRRWKG